MGRYTADELLALAHAVQETARLDAEVGDRSGGRLRIVGVSIEDEDGFAAHVVPATPEEGDDGFRVRVVRPEPEPVTPAEAPPV